MSTQVYPKTIDDFVELIIEKFEINVEDATWVAKFLSIGDMVHYESFLHHMRRVNIDIKLQCPINLIAHHILKYSQDLEDTLSGGSWTVTPHDVTNFLAQFNLPGKEFVTEVMKFKDMHIDNFKALLRDILNEGE